MPMNRADYPPHWELLSNFIRFVRAGGRCEWRHNDINPATGARVILTTAHLVDPNPMNCDPENLMAMCQTHHLRYDAPRRKKRANT